MDGDQPVDDAGALTDLPIQLAAARAARGGDTGVAGRAGLLLRVTTNRPTPRQPADQDPANHFAFATGTRDWTCHEATAQVPPDANYIFFGVFLRGPGQIELRNPQLEPHPASQEQQPGKASNAEAKGGPGTC